MITWLIAQKSISLSLTYWWSKIQYIVKVIRPHGWHADMHAVRLTLNRFAARTLTLSPLEQGCSIHLIKHHNVSMESFDVANLKKNISYLYHEPVTAMQSELFQLTSSRIFII